MTKVLNRKDKKQYKMINIRLKLEEAEDIEKQAEKENRNITNFIKNCILKYLKSKENNQKCL